MGWRCREAIAGVARGRTLATLAVATLIGCLAQVAPAGSAATVAGRYVVENRSTDHAGRSSARELSGNNYKISGRSGIHVRARCTCGPHMLYGRAHSDPILRGHRLCMALHLRQRSEFAGTRWPQWLWSVTRLVFLRPRSPSGCTDHVSPVALFKAMRDRPAA